MVFGPKAQIPFRKQTQLSVLSRLRATEIDTHFIGETCRYDCAETLELCAIANDRPDLKAVEGSFDVKKTEQYSAVNLKAWGIDKPVINVSPKSFQIMGGVTMKYSLEHAQLVMKTMVDACKLVPGDRIGVFTIYDAEKRLLLKMQQAAIAQALAIGNRKLASELAKVLIMNVDSSIGQDKDYVIVDFAGYLGHVKELPRTNVLATRAKAAVTFILPALEFTNTDNLPASHPLNRIIQSLYDKKCIRDIWEREIKSFEQYASTMVSMGAWAEANSSSAYTSAATLANIPFTFRSGAFVDDIETEEDLDLKAMIETSIGAMHSGSWDTGDTGASGDWDTGDTGASGDWGTGDTGASGDFSNEWGSAENNQDLKASSNTSANGETESGEASDLQRALELSKESHENEALEQAAIQQATTYSLRVVKGLRVADLAKMAAAKDEGRHAAKHARLHEIYNQICQDIVTDPGFTVTTNPSLVDQLAEKNGISLGLLHKVMLVVGEPGEVPALLHEMGHDRSLPGPSIETADFENVTDGRASNTEDTGYDDYKDDDVASGNQ